MSKPEKYESALARSFSEHAERVRKKGTCWVESWDGVKSTWVSTSNAVEVNRCIQRCRRLAIVYGG